MRIPGPPRTRPPTPAGWTFETRSDGPVVLGSAIHKMADIWYCPRMQIYRNVTIARIGPLPFARFHSCRTANVHVADMPRTPTPDRWARFSGHRAGFQMWSGLYRDEDWWYNTKSRCYYARLLYEIGPLDGPAAVEAAERRRNRRTDKRVGPQGGFAALQGLRAKGKS